MIISNNSVFSFFIQFATTGGVCIVFMIEDCCFGGVEGRWVCCFIIISNRPVAVYLYIGCPTEKRVVEMIHDDANYDIVNVVIKNVFFLFFSIYFYFDVVARSSCVEGVVSIYWRLRRPALPFVGLTPFALHFFVICLFCSQEGSLLGFSLSFLVIWL